MDRPGGERAPAKEPIRKPWIWVVIVIILLAGIPWYLPQGSVQPVFFGVPYWMLIAVVSSLALCGFLSWLCLNEWDVVEAEEERAVRERASGSEGEEV